MHSLFYKFINSFKKQIVQLLNREAVKAKVISFGVRGY